MIRPSHRSLPAVWFLLAASLVCPASAGQADPANQGRIVRDSSLGSGRDAVVRDGTDPLGQHAEYLIRADLGEQRGGNLFHSFRQFGLGAGEVASFTEQGQAPGAPAISNVITRVTGGSPSEIDGMLRSTIPGADVFLLNPAGVIFGPDSKLDVSGSFHATTADLVRLGESETYIASLARESVLSVAAPEAFGFLTAPAPIRIKGFLEVRPHEALTITAGGIQVTGDLDQPTKPRGVISAPDGLVRLTSVASSGEVAGIRGDETRDLVLTGFTAQGSIELLDGATVSSSGLSPVFRPVPGGAFAPPGRLDFPFANSGGPVTPSLANVEPNPQPVREDDVFLGRGLFDTTQSYYLRPLPRSEGAGSVYIRADTLLVQDSDVQAVTPGNGIDPQDAAGLVDVDLTGDLTIRKIRRESDVGLFARTGFSIEGRVVPSTNSQGQALFDVPSTPILLQVGATGNGGDIRVRAGDVRLESGGRIAASSARFSQGRGGTIEVTATMGTVSISGEDPTDRRSHSAIFSNAQGTGDAGAITITARTLELSQGGAVIAQTQGNADAGTITITADDLRIRDTAQIDSSTSAQILRPDDPGPTTGAGGSITVVAHRVVDISGRQSETEFARISTFSKEKSTGPAGSIDVTSPLLQISDGGGIAATTSGAGAGGDITLRVTDVRLSNGGSISAQSESPRQRGRAGTIRIEAKREVRLVDVSSITTASGGSDGGSIFINALDLRTDPLPLEIIKEKVEEPGSSSGFLVYLEGGSSITTSVGAGEGAGGNIAIDPVFVILRNSTISADANNGPGGNVKIVSRFFFADPIVPFPVTADSANGDVDGQVSITAPDVDIASQLTNLPAGFLDAASLLRERCGTRQGGSSGSFVVSERAGVADSPDGPLAAPAVEPGPAASLGRSSGGAEPMIAGLELRSEATEEPVGFLYGCEHAN